MIDDTLAGLVIESCNDVLRGYQSFEEHLEYLREVSKEFPKQLDLSEPQELERKPFINETRENINKIQCNPVKTGTRPEEKAAGPIQGRIKWSD